MGGRVQQRLVDVLPAPARPFVKLAQPEPGEHNPPDRRLQLGRLDHPGGQRLLTRNTSTGSMSTGSMSTGSMSTGNMSTSGTDSMSIDNTDSMSTANASTQAAQTA